MIVSTASVAAFDGQFHRPVRGSSKGGVVAMTLPIARELCRSGIRVMTIAPGTLETPMLLGMPADAQGSLGKMVPFLPHGQAGRVRRAGRAHLQQVTPTPQRRSDPRPRRRDPYGRQVMNRSEFIRPQSVDRSPRANEYAPTGLTVTRKSEIE